MLAFLSYQLLDHKKEESSPCWCHVLRSFTWNFGILQNNIENLRVATKFFFFQHLNEKENQLNYVLAVLYKQCIVRRTYFHIFQFFKVFNVSVKNNFIKQILSS